MVAYAKNSGVFDHIAVATNSSLLTNGLALRLVDSGLDLIKISVEAVSDEGYRRIARVPFDYRQLIDRVAFLYANRKGCKVYAKIIDYGLSEADKAKFYDDFNDISDFITIDTVSGWSVTSAKDFTLGSNPGKYLDLPSFNKKEVCPVAFYSLSINFNGEVSICCVDWTMSTVVGDLRRESIVDLWNGEQLFEFRKMHLTGNRSAHKACGDCFAVNGWIDNVDAQAGEILRRLTKQQETSRLAPPE
jgi:radical SAM protein with 4Fe4S-binding SPASM domain